MRHLVYIISKIVFWLHFFIHVLSCLSLNIREENNKTRLKINDTFLKRLVIPPENQSLKTNICPIKFMRLGREFRRLYLNRSESRRVGQFSRQRSVKTVSTSQKVKKEK